MDAIVKALVKVSNIDLKTTIRVVAKALVVLTVATELLKAVLASLLGVQ